jgi:AcrR family transcriptional regulator
MGRRSDHSRDELAAMILAEGHRQLAEVGYARFSARELAKRIGYSVGTLYNVFGSLDQLMLAINGVTLDGWRAYLETRLAVAEGDRLKTAISAYFEYALLNRHAWTALYDFRLPEGVEAPDSYTRKVEAIFEVVVAEIAAVLPPNARAQAPALARSLLASVHGHCFFTINGTFALLGEADPLGAAHARVAEAIAAQA